MILHNLLPPTEQRHNLRASTFTHAALRRTARNSSGLDVDQEPLSAFQEFDSTLVHVEINQIAIYRTQPGRLLFNLDPSARRPTKTRANFVALCTDERDVQEWSQ